MGRAGFGRRLEALIAGPKTGGPGRKTCRCVNRQPGFLPAQLQKRKKWPKKKELTVLLKWAYNPAHRIVLNETAEGDVLRCLCEVGDFG